MQRLGTSVQKKDTILKVRNLMSVVAGCLPFLGSIETVVSWVPCLLDISISVYFRSATQSIKMTSSLSADKLAYNIANKNSCIQEIQSKCIYLRETCYQELTVGMALISNFWHRDHH